MSETVYNITELIVRLAVLLIVAFVVPAIKKWLEGKQINTAIQKSVYCVQQLYWNEDGKDRKKVATEMAKELLEKAGIKIDSGQLSALIEAAVQELHVARGDYKE